ncbi:LysM peptidoglycan-binding domain-containing protein [Litoribacter alkaliphilus]|uniref:LysM peptidoglycan-binding domain-containing protein n=1 Tax=Litoribacter ruber TaxID=702568 RepID=A0AAP2CJT6_9BACT|nr:LysM peptidoglycan-binding domain-containing protein [Litoribacter alkaliphilus]MBS9524999.1 LysM peptidoglycan-binding domain-containing protein [Litoribacter alkaliphilus]
MRVTPLLFAFILFSHLAFAQVPQVPREIKFADMTLRLNAHAQREIQQDVDALYRSPQYFQMKLDRVNLYMPTIERVLREEGVPMDVKYMVIQESSLIPDAVSTSNAVGFWQFKKGTAEEVYLRVDNQIDERKNVVSSTRGAARYLKKHHGHLDNWMTTVVSYLMGLGGAKGYYGTSMHGKKVVDIDKNTHWYFKKFLAHKIAFENQVGKLVSNGTYLEEFRVNGPTDFGTVARQLGVTEAHLREYNKWSSNGKIPGDRTYTVVYVRDGSTPPRPALASNQPQTDVEIYRNNQSAYPRVTGNTSRATQPGQIKVNNIKAVQAAQNSSIEAFADRIGKNERKIRRVNDLKKKDRIEAGSYYYTKRKKAKAKHAEEHVVKAGETLWEISQLHGIRLNSLKAKNRIYKDKDLRPGMVLKLQDYRKRNEEIEMARPSTPKPQNPPARQVAQQETQTAPARQNAPSQPAAQIFPAKPAESRTNTTVHKVSPGETLYAISRKYEVTVDELRNWNNLGVESILSIGQDLIIRK